MSGSNKAHFLLSSDTLSGYGLDLVFQVAKDLNFDGVDLALWKNFDAWNIDYIKRLVEKYETPVKVIQLSNKVNRKELNYAIDLAKEVGADVISINSPYIYDFTTYKFIINNLPAYKKQNPKIKFSIINPPKASLFALPVPKYYFSNIIEIIKKQKLYIGMDIANMDESALETTFLRKISNFVPYIGVVYISDKTKTGAPHVSLGEGILKIPSILKKFKQHEYFGYFSLKLDIDKKDLLDLEKVQQILKKNRLSYKENYEDLVID